MANYTPDSTDRKILDILQGNATIPNIELADKVCLSPSPCSRRVKNLRDEGFIRQAVTLLEPSKVGLPVSVFIQVNRAHDLREFQFHSCDFLPLRVLVMARHSTH